MGHQTVVLVFCFDIHAREARWLPCQPHGASRDPRPSGTMSEAEGEWEDMMHRQDTLTAQASETSQASLVRGPPDTVPEPKRYGTSPPKGTQLATMAHFFGPVGATATGAGRGLVTRTRHLFAPRTQTRISRALCQYTTHSDHEPRHRESFALIDC